MCCRDADGHGHRAVAIHQLVRTACCHHFMGPINFIIFLAVCLSLSVSLRLSSQLACGVSRWPKSLLPRVQDRREGKVTKVLWTNALSQHKHTLAEHKCLGQHSPSLWPHVHMYTQARLQTQTHLGEVQGRLRVEVISYEYSIPAAACHFNYQPLPAPLWGLAQVN